MFPSLENAAHQKGSTLEFASRRVNSFLGEVAHLRREAEKGKIVQLRLLKIYPFTLTVFIRNMLLSTAGYQSVFRYDIRIDTN